MTRESSRLGQAAAALVGCRFRLHGLDPASGLDCVGLVYASLAALGFQPVAPRGYGLRNLSIDQWLEFAERSGLEPTEEELGPDQVLLVDLGFGQHHLMITTEEDEVVHAHAGLSRVVKHRRDPSMHICKRWRLRPTAKG